HRWRAPAGITELRQANGCCRGGARGCDGRNRVLTAIGYVNFASVAKEGSVDGSESGGSNARDTVSGHIDAADRSRIFDAGRRSPGRGATPGRIQDIAAV